MRRKAFLLKKNLRITRKNNKLNHVKIKSFEILRNIKRTNFELKLSNNIKKKTFNFSRIFIEISTLKHINARIIERIYRIWRQQREVRNRRNTELAICQAHRDSIVYLVTNRRRSEKWERKKELWELINPRRLSLLTNPIGTERVPWSRSPDWVVGTGPWHN
jgi:hypothetical protein